MPLSIVFEDSHLLVIDKPAGMVVTPAKSHRQKTISEILHSEYGINLERGGVVHRLDKDTSGLLVAAKSLESHQALQSQFKDRTIKKKYLSLVHGDFKEPTTVDAPIDRNPQDREKFTVIQEGREAVTKFEPIELMVMGSEFMEEIFKGFTKIQFKKLRAMNYEQFTLLACHPLTGRTHQIRVHLKYLGFPIVADERYGGRKTVRLDKRWCPRQFLHASKLEFDHPMTGKRLSFESRLPEDLTQALKHLKNV